MALAVSKCSSCPHQLGVPLLTRHPLKQSRGLQRRWLSREGCELPAPCPAHPSQTCSPTAALSGLLPIISLTRVERCCSGLHITQLGSYFCHLLLQLELGGLLTPQTNFPGCHRSIHLRDIVVMPSLVCSDGSVSASVPHGQLWDGTWEGGLVGLL